MFFLRRCRVRQHGARTRYRSSRSLTGSADEAANLNGDQVFVSRVRSDPGSAGGEFDDIVTWLSENVLYNRMVAAGQLP